YVEELSRANRPIGKVIEISRIAPNPEQPRVEFGDLTELTESIREKGVLEPLLVRPNKDGTYMIIAGERRWRSSQLAGLTEVPCIEIDLDEQGVAEIALIENLQRKDLTLWEEADGLAALSSKFGYTHDEIAKKISKSRSTVTELMTIAGLPQHIRERCRELNIGAKAALLEVARQFDEAAMVGFLENYDENKKKKEAVKKNGAEPAASTNGSPAAARPAREPRSVFRHRPVGAAFTVEVKFDDASECHKRGVLQALKQAFDDLKNEVTEIS
ncbi:MAG TPA: ParB/RepB/Spo0J family partition protein, partial [Pyrinomonadaceae bacterium]|nr:ParB/RepB/Spo0J family partition protein [Pyrinomonadaceae bacterium]